jgi:signal transduction histidine kinase
MNTPSGSEVVVAVETPAQIRVSDHGPGVPPNDRKAVFARFWRKPGQVRTGAGLGLAIVEHVAKAHHGVITIEDAPDGGACSVICLSVCASWPEPSGEPC